MNFNLPQGCYPHIMEPSQAEIPITVGYPQFPWVPLFQTPSISLQGNSASEVPAQDVLCRLPPNGAYSCPEYLYLQPRPNMAYYLDTCPQNSCPRTVYEVPVNLPNPPPASISCDQWIHKNSSSLATPPEFHEVINNNSDQDYQNQVFELPQPVSELSNEKSCQTDFHPTSKPSGKAQNYIRTAVDLSEIFGHPIPKPNKPQALPQNPSKVYCKFCRSNGEPYDKFSTHSLKNELNETVCPILCKYICPICGKTGTEAHTQRYCPLAPTEETPQTRFYRKVRNSVGKFRILKY